MTPVLIYWVPISIHAPRVGSDRGHDLHKVRHRAFQSTLPVWGATSHLTKYDRYKLISIHAPRVGSDFYIDIVQRIQHISIHAPRVGSDEGNFC